MTEEQWESWSGDPAPMLEVVCEQYRMARTRPGSRKLRLFACACARRLGHRLTPIDGMKVIGISERFADHLLAVEGWRAFQEMAGDLQAPHAPLAASGQAVWATVNPAAHVAARAASFHARRALEAEDPSLLPLEQAAQCDLLRCLFGNPFRRPRIDAAAWLTWNGGMVLQLTQAIVREQAYERLPILGDALEEAGCRNELILHHCHGRSCWDPTQQLPHARGCWVIDLLARPAAIRG